MLADALKCFGCHRCARNGASRFFGTWPLQQQGVCYNSRDENQPILAATELKSIESHDIAVALLYDIGANPPTADSMTRGRRPRRWTIPHD
jgi:hypothetical protein